MDLERYKALAFRHCEKAALAVIVLFVGLNIYSHLPGAEDAAEPWNVQAGRRTPRTVSKGIPAQIFEITAPYTEVPTPTEPRYDPFWPPAVRVLETVELQAAEPGKENADRKAPEKIAGPLKVVELTAAEKREVADVAPTGDACRVKVTVDPSDGRTIHFKAEAKGSAVAYEGVLESKDKVRVVVYVQAQGVKVFVDLPAPKILGVYEDPLGVLNVRIEPPKVPEKGEASPDKETHIVRKLLQPTGFQIWRQGEGDKEKTLIGKKDLVSKTKGPESGEPPTGAPGTALPGLPKLPGLPGLPKTHAGTPGGPAPGKEPVPGKAKGEVDFVDADVQSETSYTYWVRSIIEDDKGQITKESKEFSNEWKATTKQRFTIVPFGGTDREARIAVIIGPEDQDLVEGLNAKIYKVSLGGRIGELPLAAAPAAKPAEEGKEAAAAGEAASRFVTGFVLVDIVADSFRLIEQMSKVPERDENGRITHREVKTYRAILSRQAIVRDRKGRLVALWFKAPPKIAPPPKEKEPAKAK